jgi:hypothetical protein
MKNPERQYLCIRWEDAHGSVSDELSDDEIKYDLQVFQTYGWLVGESEKVIVIAGEWRSETKTWRSINWIPQKNVIEREVLVVSKPRAKRKPKEVQSG